MNELKSLLQKFKLKREGSPFGWGASPDADWKVIFLSTLVLVIVVGGWSYLEFNRIIKGEIFVSKEVSEGGAPLFDLENLKKTAAYYEAKALEFEKIKSGTTSSVVDPSI
jgi:hypothetical protein